MHATSETLLERYGIVSREAAHAWLERVRARLLPGLGVRMLWWRLIGQARPWRGWRAYGLDTAPAARDLSEAAS